MDYMTNGLKESEDHMVFGVGYSDLFTPVVRKKIETFSITQFRRETFICLMTSQAVLRPKNLVFGVIIFLARSCFMSFFYEAF